MRNDHEHADAFLKATVGALAPSTTMYGDGPADLAPNLGTVFTRCRTGDVNACTAFALYNIGHDEGQPSVLHQVNASFPSDDGLKNDEAFGC